MSMVPRANSTVTMMMIGKKIANHVLKYSA